MGKDNWIQEQRQAGKKDEDILLALTKKGWTEPDARKALETASKPPLAQQLSNAEIGVFAGALLGIFAFLWTALDLMGNEPLQLRGGYPVSVSNPVNALLVVLAITLFAWSLYALSIRHHHPKLHKLFFLVVGKIVSAGYSCWLLLAALALARATDTVVTTFALILGAGALLTLGVILLELVYYRLRAKYDSLPAKSAKRLVIVGLSLFIVYVVVLSASAYYAENWVVGRLDAQNADTFSRMEPQVATAKAAIGQVRNPILQDRFSNDLAEYERLQGTRMQPFTVDEFISDSGWETRCDALLAAPTATMHLYSDARLAQDYLQYSARPRADAAADITEYERVLAVKPFRQLGNISLPLRYKPYETLRSCGFDELLLENPYYRGLPQRPDLSDAGQRELVEFVLWREEHLVKATT